MAAYRGRSTWSLDAMRALGMAASLALILALGGGLAWYLRPASTKKIVNLDDVDLIVDVDYTEGGCTVKVPNGSVRKHMACGEVSTYARDMLRLKAGSTFGVVSFGKSVPPLANVVVASLSGAGYIYRVKMHLEPPEIPRDGS